MTKFNRNNEIWKPILDFPGYEVSNMGRIKSVDRTILRKDGTNQFCKGVVFRQLPDKNGYLRVCLRKRGKRYTKIVHRLVGKAFVSGYSESLQTNHIDEVKTNNKANNLEYVTPLENSNHGTRNKKLSLAKKNGKTSLPVVGINIKTGEKLYYPSAREVERSSNGYFQQSNVSRTCLGLRKTHKGYKWKYQE